MRSGGDEKDVGCLGDSEAKEVGISFLGTLTSKRGSRQKQRKRQKGEKDEELGL